MEFLGSDSSNEDVKVEYVQINRGRKEFVYRHQLLPFSEITCYHRKDMKEGKDQREKILQSNLPASAL